MVGGGAIAGWIFAALAGLTAFVFRRSLRIPALLDALGKPRMHRLLLIAGSFP